MIETTVLEYYSATLGFEVCEAEAITPTVVRAVLFINGKFINTLIADPDSQQGWWFMHPTAATFRAAEGRNASR